MQMIETPDLSDFVGNYGMVRSLDGVKKLADLLMSQGKTISFDVETGYTGPDRRKGSLDIYWPLQFVVGFSITNDVRWARYVPLLHDFGENLDPEKVWPIMKPVLETLEMTNHNCFSGDAEFLTRDRGLSRLDELAGTVQEVWNGSAWMKADIRSFGTAPVREVVLAPNGRSRSFIRHVFRATDNHRWEMVSGRILTTDELSTSLIYYVGRKRIKDAVKAAVPIVSVDKHSEAFIHGLIFADGSLCSKQPKHAQHYCHQIRLCGWKEEFKDRFDSYTYPPSSHGDPVALHTSQTNMKQLPSDDVGDQYVADFIEGWQLLDGSRSGGYQPKDHTRSLTTTSSEGVAWLERNAVRGGWVVAGSSRRFEPSGYQPEGVWMHHIVLSKDPALSWRVVSVGPSSSNVEVFCATVHDGPERFTLAGGVLTGNSVFELRNLAALERKGHGPAIHPPWDHLQDTVVQSYVLGESQFHALKYLSGFWFNYAQTEIMHLFEVDGKKLTQAQMEAIRYNVLPLTPEVINYVCDDVTWGLRLDQHQRPLLLADGVKPPSLGFIYQLEREIIGVLLDMAETGVAVDWEGIDRGVEDFERFYDRMEAETRRLFEEGAGRELPGFNFRSVPQLRSLLFNQDEGLGLVPAMMTKHESNPQPSTSEASLEAIRHQHPAVEQLINYRKTKKMGEWFQLWSKINTSYDGKVHPSFNQVRVQSGRFASDAPNVQNITKKWWFTTVTRDYTEFPPGKEGDAAFVKHVKAIGTNGHDYWAGNARDYLVASPGYTLLSFDYRAQEMRVLAGLSQEPYLIGAFRDGIDVHRATAALMFGVPIEEVTDEQRQKGKTIGFGNVYGQSPKGMSTQLGISKDEAEKLYNLYFGKFTKVAEWFTRVKREGFDKGMVYSFLGRRSRIWELLSDNRAIRSKAERMFVNIPVQGGGADITKLAMVRAKRAMVKRGWWNTKVRLLMNQHDALIFEVSDELDLAEVKDALEPQVSFPIPEHLGDFPPFAVDWEYGPRWGSCIPWGEEDPQVQSFEKPSKLTLRFLEPPARDRFQELIKVLKSHPGEVPVVIALGEDQKPTPITVSVDGDLMGAIQDASEEYVVEVSTA